MYISCTRVNKVLLLNVNVYIQNLVTKTTLAYLNICKFIFIALLREMNQRRGKCVSVDTRQTSLRIRSSW